MGRMKITPGAGLGSGGLPQAVKELAYKLDPECWVSYFGKPRPFKQAMEVRRQASLDEARRQLPPREEEDDAYWP